MEGLFDGGPDDTFLVRSTKTDGFKGILVSRVAEFGEFDEDVCGALSRNISQ
jgi:hypothetical protein